MTDAATTATVATDGAATTGQASTAQGAAQTTTATLLTGAAATGGASTGTDDAAAKAAADAAAAAAKAKEVPQGAPERYADFKFAEGFDAKPDDVTAFGTVARELNLTQEGAQKLVDLQTKMAQAQVEAQQNQHAAMLKGWRDASAADKEFGGANIEANAAIAVKALQQFGTPELTKFLTDTGLGNHPELVRAFYRVGKALGEDKHIAGGVSSGKPEQTLAQRMYPSKT